MVADVGSGDFSRFCGRETTEVVTTNRKPRQNPRLYQARLACPRRAQHRHERLLTNQRGQLLNLLLPTEKERTMVLVVGLQASIGLGLVVGGEGRRGRQVEWVAGHEEDELALAMLVQRPQARRLFMAGLFFSLHFDLFTQVEVQLGGGDDAVPLAFGHQVGSAPRQSVDQRQGERRVRPAVAGQRPALGVARKHVQRGLVVRRRGQHLPGRRQQVAIVALLVDHVRQRAEVAGG